MASSKLFEFMVLFQAMFIPLATMFGVTFGGPTLFDAVAGPQSVISQPFLDFASMLNTIGFTGFKSCGFLDFNCNGANIAQATIYAGAIIGYAGLLMFQIMQKIGAGIFLIFAMTNFFGNSFGIPFVGQIQTGFLLLTIVYGLALIKPGGHGGS